MTARPDEKERVRGVAVAELLYAAADLRGLAGTAREWDSELTQLALRLEAAAMRLESGDDKSGGLRVVASDEPSTAAGGGRPKR